MLKLESTTAAPLVITQVNSNPSVYLDQWALRKFSFDPSLSERFTEGLRSRGGMLELSFLHMLEFSRVSDPRQVTAAEAFLERLCPEYIGFIDVIPKKVIERENCFLNKEPNPIDPHVDYALLQLFGTRRSESLAAVSFKGLLSQHERLQEMCADFLQEINPNLEAARTKAADPHFSSIVASTPNPRPDVQHLTRYIDLVAARILATGNIKMNSNHWRDYFHMVVPMAYCDYLILDSTWEAIATQVQNRLRAAGHEARMARVFSERTLADFWVALKITPNS